MRYLIPVVVALIVGVAGGLGVAYFDVGRETAHLEIGLTDIQDDSGPGVARVEVEGGTDFNFGSTEVGSTGHHVFVLHNTGTKPLVLNVEDTTCKCTVGTLDRGTVPPGESVEVRMEWTPPHFDEDFRQRATITTNDPDHREVKLWVIGRADIAVRAPQDQLQLGSIQVSDTRTESTKLYGFREGGFEITGMRLLRDDLAEYFETEVRPLSEDELAEVIGAHGGYEVTFTILPGMPLGMFEQTLEITTSLQSVQPVKIKVQGELVGDISLVGGEVLDVPNSLLKLDLVRSGQGRTETIYVMVNGPHRDEVDLQIGEIDPAGILQATLGERVELSGGQLYSYPLEISIPPGAPSVNRFGGTAGPVGTISIETGHPTSPRLILRVRFAVEG